ncbi:MAG: hypothetical protein A2284_17735 [Deltaproteobacteria bacterium RIFOXYA12_FULL_61_11]|nr:MAG: hypothetical protein A2284_17735 [Deltaproteobacteria bacterium RIFOXYA12_FULL_61_11]
MRPTRAAETITSWELVFPNDANTNGSMFGGRLMALMDKAGGIAASRFTGRPVVTASTEALHFLAPVKIGDRIEVRARVVWTGTTSLIVLVEVVAETPGDESRRPCTTGHFTFVALGTEGRPVEIPSLLLDSPAARAEHRVAEIVKRKALERREGIAAPDSSGGR